MNEKKGLTIEGEEWIEKRKEQERKKGNVWSSEIKLIVSEENMTKRKNKKTQKAYSLFKLIVNHLWNISSKSLLINHNFSWSHERDFDSDASICIQPVITGGTSTFMPQQHWSISESPLKYQTSVVMQNVSCFILNKISLIISTKSSENCFGILQLQFI